MKLNFFIFHLLFFSSFLCVAQEKFSNQWVVGYPPDKGQGSVYGAYLMDFNDDSLKLVNIPKASLVTYTSAPSICNKDGKLQLYSNGCQIHNGDFQVVEDCENINPGEAWDDYCSDQSFASYPLTQSELFLPYPDYENMYFHLTHKKEFSQKYNWDQFQYFTEMYQCHVIDMNLNNGNGKSINTFILKYPEVIKGYNLAACKHANGKDWWIINYSFNTKTFYRLLLTKDGLSGPWEQADGPPRDSDNSVGQSNFSFDGKKYACIYSATGKVWLMDFDRKTGLFSKLQILNYETYPDWDFRGVAFSPNNQYLYISAGYYLYQFDIKATNIQDSKILIDTYDGYEFPAWPIANVFGFEQLAPDGKIYVGQFSGSVRHWSVINKPNEPGIACEFKQHSLFFPGFSLPATPIQPNYALGPDTTTFTKSVPNYQLSMKSWFDASSKVIKCWLQNLPKDKDTYTLSVNDITGRALISQKLSIPKYQEDINLDGSDLVPGVYIINLLDKDNRVAYDKVMVY